jgi:hypothetical protein
LELYLWDGESIRRITHFGEKGLKPDIAGYSLNNAGQVAFAAGGEVYLYTPPVAGSVALDPSPVVEGKPSTGIVTLAAPAPPGGALVSLSSPDPSAAALPTSVSVPAGAITATFPITTHLVPAPTSVAIRASYAGSTWTTALQIWHALPASLDLDMQNVIGGLFPPTGTITLDGEAPAGGVVITLASDNPAVSVPATVKVLERRTTATFPVGTRPVGVDTFAQITASYSGVTRMVHLRVEAPPLTSLVLRTNPVTGGAPCLASVGLKGGAPDSGLEVALSSSNPAAAAVPASALVAPGADSVWFSIMTHLVAASTPVRISASVNGKTTTQDLVVLSFGLAEVVLPSQPITGGHSGSGAIVLSAPTPAGGAVIYLGSDNPSVVTIPLMIKLPAGATVGVFPISTRSVTQATSVVISAYYAGLRQQATLTVNP